MSVTDTSQLTYIPLPNIADQLPNQVPSLKVLCKEARRLIRIKKAIERNDPNTASKIVDIFEFSIRRGHFLLYQYLLPQIPISWDQPIQNYNDFMKMILASAVQAPLSFQQKVFHRVILKEEKNTFDQLIIHTLASKKNFHTNLISNEVKQALIEYVQDSEQTPIYLDRVFANETLFQQLGKNYCSFHFLAQTQRNEKIIQQTIQKQEDKKYLLYWSIFHGYESLSTEILATIDEEQIKFYWGYYFERAIETSQFKTSRNLLTKIDSSLLKNPIYFPNESLLHLAAKGNIVEDVKKLDKFNLDPNLKNSEGLSPLHIAAQKNHIRSIEVLAEIKADLDIKNSGGETPLFFAVRYGNLIAVMTLQSLGASLNIQNASGETPLHTSVIWNHLKILKVLHKFGADPNIQDTNGNTPLHKAVRLDHSEIVQELCHMKVNLDLQNKRGETPLDKALKLGNAAIIKALKN